MMIMMHWTDLFCGGIIEIEIQKQKKKHAAQRKSLNYYSNSENSAPYLVVSTYAVRRRGF